ncbi:hypothetical protein Ppa06_58460 [Planomonospora parontospora subsp. parontospora]|uniref:Uncharacterized protein n=2 Tax=Planomonospora parontospora TaxID=58119 RepID=A0AA37BMH3_9ACTN|nr:hypothetical protein [Planomonospora parontospora]GGK91143.1 hypothetical protein GCM10010126_58200 [Planomonospora parontospora]GII12048.1 hypothetical protein Ppa06_58460 [Planomonospora parontospora subsp. parontospora]
MALSRLAQEFAAEINLHDWSDAPYRRDRAGHRRENDSPSKLTDTLSETETDSVRMNAMWVVAQVLAHRDPNFDVYEFAEACGVDTRTNTGRRDGGIEAGLRKRGDHYQQPGMLE